MVYLVCCNDGSLYAGIATDVARRLAQHNGQLAGGARYTRARRPVRLVYEESAASRSAAAKREYQIKQLSRRDKLLLIGISASQSNGKPRRQSAISPRPARVARRA